MSIFENLITVLFCALLSLPVICYQIEILVVRGERDGMGIAHGNGRKMGIKLG